MQDHPSPLVPFLVACGGIALFSLMDALMKEGSLAIGAYSMVLWRSVIGAALAGILFVATRERWPGPALMRLHLWRSTVVAGMAVCFFFSLTRLPIAEAVGLSFIAPVLTLFLAALMLDETIGRRAVWASVLGLAGVGVILAGRLAGSYDARALEGVAAVLVSAVLYAYNLILARRQAKQASPIAISFFQALLVAAVLSLFAPWAAVPPQIGVAVPILGSAVLALCSLLLLSWAYARAQAQVLVSVEYTAFAWAALFGWLFFREPVTVATLAGTALIVVSSIVAATEKGGSRPGSPPHADTVGEPG